MLVVSSKTITTAIITRTTGIFPIDCSGIDLVPQITNTGGE